MGAVMMKWLKQEDLDLTAFDSNWVGLKKCEFLLERAKASSRDPIIMVSILAATEAALPILFIMHLPKLTTIRAGFAVMFLAAAVAFPFAKRKVNKKYKSDTLKLAERISMETAPQLNKRQERALRRAIRMELYPRSLISSILQWIIFPSIVAWIGLALFTSWSYEWLRTPMLATLLVTACYSFLTFREDRASLNRREPYLSFPERKT